MDVPKRLAPLEGTSEALVQFVGFDVDLAKGGGVFKFQLIGEDDEHIGTVGIAMDPAASFDGMLIDAHKRMTDVIRQWLAQIDRARSGYEGDDEG